MSDADDGGVALYTGLLTDPRFLSVLLVSIASTMGGNVARPALPGIAAGLGVSDAAIGLVISAYTLPTAICVPVAGTLADVYGRRTVVLPSLVVFGVAGTAIAFVGGVTGATGALPLTPFQGVLALRVLQGVAVAGVGTLTVTLLGDLYDGDRGAVAQGTRVGANKINNILAPVMVGVLAGIAWNFPFLLYAFAFPVAALAYRYLPSTVSPRDASASVRAVFREYARSLRVELRDRNLRLLVSGGGVRDFVKAGVLTFVPIFAVRELGASLAVAGAVLSARGFAGIVAAPLSGAVVSRSSRKGTLLAGLLVGIAGVLAIPLSPSVPVLWVAVAVFGVGDALFAPVLKDAVTDNVADDTRAGVVGGMNTLKKTVQTIGPAFFGVVLTVAGFDPIFYVAAVAAAGYLVVLLVALPAEA
ncbi:MAG: MFS transporter [Haloferacaceae archaeon]